jgi:hypothetical protein
MSGLVGTASVSAQDSLLLQEDGDRYRLDVLGATGVGASRRLWFDRRSLQVVREDRFSESGELEASIEYEDFRPVEELRNGQGPPGQPATEFLKPFRITIQDGRGRGMLLLTFHEIVPNPDLDPTDLGLDSGNVSLQSGEHYSHVAVGR